MRQMMSPGVVSHAEDDEAQVKKRVPIIVMQANEAQRDRGFVSWSLVQSHPDNCLTQPRSILMKTQTAASLSTFLLSMAGVSD